MVPAHFVCLPALPLTANGKLDRKALPAPDHARDRERHAIRRAAHAAEETIAGIWEAVLGVDTVGVDDNFFELGGDSILSIQVIARCRQAGCASRRRTCSSTRRSRELAAVVRVAAGCR